MRRALVASIALAAGTLGCAERCRSEGPKWPVSPPAAGASEARASALLSRTLRTYEGRSTYRDRGTVVSRLRSRRDRGVRIAYFDTVFLRDVGLRFRYYDERRELKYAIWSTGATAKLWFLGTRSTTTLPLAIASITGVTEGVAAIVPQLLLGERAFHSFPPLLAGIEASCGRCEILLWHAPGGRHESITLDEGENAIRRLESHELIKDDVDGDLISDVYVIYEPSSEAGSIEALTEELSVQPW